MIKDNRINYQINHNFILNKKNEPPKGGSFFVISVKLRPNAS